MYGKYFKNRSISPQDEFVLWNHTPYQKRIEILIQTYIRMISKIASRYRYFGLPMEDLIQEGIIGLMRAEARYEPSREGAFFGYARLWVKGSIQNFVLCNWSIVRNASQGQKKYFLLEAQRTREALGEYVFNFQKDVSLNQVIDDTGSELQDYLGAVSENSFESNYHDDQRLEHINELLSEVMSSLSPMERQIILEKFFLQEFEVNFSEKKRARLESQALRKMFVYFRTNAPMLRKLTGLLH